MCWQLTSNKASGWHTCLQHLFFWLCGCHEVDLEEEGLVKHRELGLCSLLHLCPCLWLCLAGTVARVVLGCIWTCLRVLGRCGPALSLRRFRESSGHRWNWLSQSPAGYSAGGRNLPRPWLDAGWHKARHSAQLSDEFPQESCLHRSSPSLNYKRSLAIARHPAWWGSCCLASMLERALFQNLSTQGGYAYSCSWCTKAPSRSCWNDILTAYLIHLESMEGPRLIVRHVFAGHLREPIWLLHRWTPQGRTGSPSEKHTSERGVQMLFLCGLWET